MSIDALRGFDMLLIIGGGTFVVLLKSKTGWPWVDWLADQLEHPAWNGFTFYDFIFPLFLFTSGVSLSFSFKSRLGINSSYKDLYAKALRRALVLILLGILDKNSPLDVLEPNSIRYGTVLGRIGLATFLTTIIYLNVDLSRRVLLALGILITYWAALFWIPVPGYGAGDLSLEGNLPGWIDRSIMPGRLQQKLFDQLALGTFLPALCLTIFGSVAGDLLLQKEKGGKIVLHLLVAGCICIVTGVVWGLVFPINKHLWSSSFVMLTSGMSFVFSALFYGLIDVAGYTKWAFFFKVIGMNSLVIYMLDRFVNFQETSQLLFGGMFKHFDEKWHEPLVAFGAVWVIWGFVYFLYKNKVFVKI